MKHKLKKIFLILFALIFLGGLTVGGYRYLQDSDRRNTSKTAKAFIAHLLADKKQDAYDMSSNSLKSVQTFAEFSAAIGSVSAKDPQYGDISLVRNGENYLFFQDIDGLPKTESGRTDGKFTITLAKEDGDWRVSSVSVQ